MMDPWKYRDRRGDFFLKPSTFRAMEQWVFFSPQKIIQVHEMIGELVWTRCCIREREGNLKVGGG